MLIRKDKDLEERNKDNENEGGNCLCDSLKHSERSDAKTRDLSYILFTDENGPFNGILHHLSETCRGNVGSKEVVKITSSGVRIDLYTATEVAVDHRSEERHELEKMVAEHSSACVSFDFQSRQVCLTGHSICYVEESPVRLRWRDLESS